MKTTLAVLAALAITPGCVSETHFVDPAGGAREQPASYDPGDDDEPLRKDPDPGTYVEVPATIAEPVQRFFDSQGFLLADKVVIHCSLQPYMGRFVTLSKVSHVAGAKEGEDGSPEHHARALSYAVRQDYENDEGYVVTITGLGGPQHMEAHVPKITFASRLLPDERPTAGPTPSFEIVATERMEIHFVKKVDPDRPSWFTLHAVGTPSPRDPSRRRPVSYFNPRTKRKLRKVEVKLRLEIVKVDGKWTAVVEEPGAR